jgi:hypothetical protein
VKPWSFEPHGRFEEAEIESKALEGNPLGDPSVRPLRIYLPPGYDDAERRYPSIYVIQGLTGQLDMWRNRAPFRKNFPELADDLFAGGDAPAAILVYADCWTSLGGSQFLDSPGTGQYHTYLCDEVVPWVDQRYRTLPASEHRGSPGSPPAATGDGHAMLRPDVFGGLATHAGDALFEACYLPEMPQTARLYVTSTTAPTSASGRTSARGRLLEGLRPRPSSTSGAWRPATRPTRTGQCGCRSTPRRQSSSPRSGSAGSPGIRCGWSRSTRTRSGR